MSSSLGEALQQSLRGAKHPIRLVPAMRELARKLGDRLLANSTGKRPFGAAPFSVDFTST